MRGRIRLQAFPAALKAVFRAVPAVLVLSLAAPSAARGQEAKAAEAPAAPAASQAEPSQDTESITVYARIQEKTKDRIFLSGNVEIRYKELRLFADRVEIDTATKDCLATGNVTIQLPNESVTAEEAHINLETKEGTLVKADGMVQPTIFYRAASLDRKAGNLYALLEARVTSCSQPVPRWRFDASRANFRKDDYVEMWNAVLHIKKVPVFYMPYMRYPVGRDRATGFLIPRIGWSEAKGFNYEQSFYWAIARNMDAEANLDYWSARGVGGGLGFRYLFRGGTGGEAHLYGFTFKRDASGEKQENAYILRLNHNQPLPLGFTLVANVDLQSSYDFLREFDNNFGRATVRNRRSEVYLQRSWSYFSLSARVSRSETYFSQINQAVVSKGLPQVSFSMFKVKLFGPVHASFTSGFSRQEYGYQREYDKGTQRKTSQVFFSPAISAPFTPFSWLTGNVSVTGNLVYYPKTYRPGTTKVVDEPLFTRNVTIMAEVVGPVFAKVYRNGQGAPVLKHTIEPFANYEYDSPIPESRRIITTYAYFFRYHKIEYGLTNRFYVKDRNDQPRELVQLGLSQKFYLAPEEGPLSRFLVDGKVPRFDVIEGRLRIYPAGRFNLDMSADFNPYYSHVTSLRLSLNAGSRMDGRYVALSWYKSYKSWFRDVISEVFSNRHQVGASAGLKLPGLPIDLQADCDYNIKQRKLLYLASSAVYHYQCLDFEFEVKVKYFLAKPDTQVKFSVGLGNIGKTTDFLGGMEF